MLYVHEVDPVPVEIQSPEFRLLMKASESNLTCNDTIAVDCGQLEHQDQLRKVIRELTSMIPLDKKLLMIETLRRRPR